MSYQGDLAEDQVLNFAFTSRGPTGLPETLADTPVLSVYKANGDAESTAGITLTVDFDTRTGLNHVRIDTSADAFYAVSNDYKVVITAGTVNGVSVVGEVVATFSIENRFDEVDITKIGGSVAALAAFKDMYTKVITTGTVSDAGPTALDFDTDLAEATDGHFDDSIVVFTTGPLTGQGRRCDVYTGVSKNIAVAVAYTEAPANGNAFQVLGRVE